jgi:ubiquinone/menaquinone biosynthesis C-methylase UbiE
MLFGDVSINDVQQYWDRRPCNIRHSAQPAGTKEYFDEVEARKYFVEPHIPGFAEFDRWKDKKVLEIGCGIGTDTINFARHGAIVTAVDLSSQSLALARQRAEVYGLNERICFYQGNAEDLSRLVPHEKYDLIYSFGVIHHTPHPERVIEQLSSYTQAGTTVKLMLYHRYSWKVLSILLTSRSGRFWRLQEAIARHSEAQTGCPVTYTYTPKEVRNLLRRFEICDIKIDHIFKYRVSDYVNYRYVVASPFAWMPSGLFHWFERHFGWHLCVTARASA